MPADPPIVREPLTRLPGRVPRLQFSHAIPQSALYLGNAGVLQVNSHLSRDAYRRFHYRDIQALQLRRTARGLAYNVILAVILAFSGLLAAAVNDLAWRGCYLGLAVIFVILLLVNTFRGPTASCLLRTAVGVYPLPSLSRLRPAQRAFDLIRERVEAVQGALPDEAVAARLDRALRERQQAVPHASFTQPAPAPAVAMPAPPAPEIPAAR